MSPAPSLPNLPPELQWAKRLAYLLDNAWEIPILRKRVGLDPLLGLLPAGGDALGVLLSLYPVWVAWRLKLPTPLYRRMLANIAIDFATGLLPVAGDLFDAAWKANTRNTQLLEKAYLASQAPGAQVVDIQAEKP